MKRAARWLLLLAGAGSFAAPALGQDLSAEERAAVFAAAGFTPRGDRYVRCDDTVTASAMTGFIELSDLNGDGSPEAWVRESSTFCYGNTAEAFVLLTRDPSGAWIKLLDEIGMALPLETAHNGWPDIEVGGPGSGPFPVYRFDGTTYMLQQ
ncbi:MAG: hypothetical protein AB7P12_15610 [Alphaproteobacteria bacterium]